MMYPATRAILIGVMVLGAIMMLSSVCNSRSDCRTIITDAVHVMVDE
jgi:hypothetical protein